MAKRWIAMTNTQLAYFNCVRDFITNNGYSPTVREIASVMGVRSTSCVSAALARLERDGYIQRGQKSPRTITILKHP